MAQDPSTTETVRVIDGTIYDRVETGYTVRQWFSHSTPEKGPGPGWDYRTRLLDDKYARRVAGRTFTGEIIWDGQALSQALPDTPHYQWVERLHD